MSNDPQLARHEKLWEQINAGQFKWYVATVAFALAAGGRLLPDYVALTQQKVATVKRIEDNRENIQRQRDNIEAEETKLRVAQGISDFLGREPAKQEQSALRRDILENLRSERILNEEENVPINLPNIQQQNVIQDPVSVARNRLGFSSDEA